MFHLTALTLGASVLLGGSSRYGLLSDVILQMTAVVLLISALWRQLAMPTDGRRWWPIALVAVIAIIPVLQLIPLPPSFGRLLPMRELTNDAVALTGTASPALPLSTTPRSTMLSALSLVVPASLFLSVSLLGLHARRRLVVVLVVTGMVGVALGLLQVAQGPNSELRFHDVTNADSAVGFFANRNHFATLINILIVFVGAWSVAMIAAHKDPFGRRTSDSSRILYLVAGLLALITLLVAQVTTYSRAGVVLMFPAIAFVLSLPFSHMRAGDENRSVTRRVVVGAVLFALALALPFAIDGIVDRFARDPLNDLRVRFARNTLDAAWAFSPWGAGAGSFIPIYELFEPVRDMVPNLYANRAHNDFLEFFLEFGFVGIAGVIGASGWLLASAYRLWIRQLRMPHELDLFLARGALIAIALLLLHSATDYPLRTGALMAVAGVCFGFLVPSLHDNSPGSQRDRSSRNERATSSSTSTRSKQRRGKRN